MPDAGSMPAVAAAAAAAAAAACEHLAYEVDDATRIITVVYMGAVDDAEVLGFYNELMWRQPDAPTYDYLVDMRYTDWEASPPVMALLDAMFRIDRPQRRLRRVAIVRRDAIVRDRTQQNLLRDLKNRDVRYFITMELARTWLQLPDS